jgi:tRNA-binding protein
MKANLFYNKKVIGDVLLVIIDQEAIATRHQRKDDVCVIYHDDQVIGINIYDISEIVKFKNEGRILLPSDSLIDIINNKIASFNIGKIDYVRETGFTVGKIISVEEHPESEHLHLLQVDIGKEILPIVCGAYNVKENLLVVVATIGTMMMDGTIIKEGCLLHEVSKGMCCSPKELGLNIEYPVHHLLELDENNVIIGQDFFSLKQI